MSNIIDWKQDSDGVVILTIDDPDQSVNTMNAAFLDSMQQTLDRAEKEIEKIKGIIITSGKKTFFAGGDLKLLSQATPKDAQALFDATTNIKDTLRRLEKLGKPVVAAINGTALGGGLEIGLAANYRVAANVKGSLIGLPEVTLGLLPGGGGITRTVRMLGLQTALMSVLLQGQRMNPSKAQKVGVIDELVDTPEELIPAAKKFIEANPEVVKPWDEKGFKIPGGTALSPSVAANLPAFPANLRKNIKGAPMPAPLAIMAAATEGTLVDFDTASTIETRYFVKLATGPVSKNMTKAFFFDLNSINAGGSRPDGFDKYKAKKVGIIGAGMMGAAIAYVSAKAGIDVVLKDVSLEGAQKGKGYSEKLEQKALSKGRTTEEKSKALLDRIHPTADAKDFDGVDFVIEAVFESVDLKHKVFQEIEEIVTPDAVLGSNTSSLPITRLAEGVKRQKDFIGIHFFSPVDKMPLVEIIRGENTSDEVLAKVIDYTLQIKKTPIVVNDSFGFFTTRVIATFIEQATAALGEGNHPLVIEHAITSAGFPVAPLQLVDELTLTLAQKLRKESYAELESRGISIEKTESDRVIDTLLEKDRKGRSTGAGFYNYDENGKRTGLWEGVYELFPPKQDGDIKDIQDRVLFAQSLETIRCFDEGVINTVADANIGSIFGIGYPPLTGGVLQFINTYPGGLKGFIERAKELESKYGSRFNVPQSLQDKADKGETYQ